MKRLGRLACGSIRLGGLVPSSVVTMPPVLLFAPIISGDVVPGMTLSSTDGVWSYSPTGYAYQWYRDGVAIVGATSSTYVAVAADVGADITCRVVASNAGGSSAPATSNILVSPWYAPIVVTLTAGGATGYLWIKDVGISTAIGQPVAMWGDVTGTVAWEQPGASSLCPILQANGLAYDGIDDRHLASSSFDTILAGSSWAFGLGIAAFGGSSTSRVFWATTDGTVNNRYNAVQNGQLGAQGGSSASLFTATAAPSGSALWYGRGGTNYTRRLGGTDVSGVWIGAPTNLALLTLGARRMPTAAVFFLGTISWAAVTNRTLSADDLDSISTTLSANGYAA